MQKSGKPGAEAGVEKELARTRNSVRLPSDLPVAALTWLAMGAMLLPILLLGTYIFSAWTAQERAAEVERVSENADTLARAVDRDLRGFVELAEVLAGSRLLQQGDIEAMDEMARDASARAGGHVFIVDRTMRQVVNTRAERGAALPLTANAGAVRHVIDTGRTTIGNLGQGAVVRQLTFAVRVPVLVAGEIRYVLAYAPRPEAMRELLDNTLLPAGWFAAVIDGGGRIIARSDRHEDFFGKRASAGFQERLSDGRGRIESTDLEGRESITAFQSSQISSWRVVVWVPKAVLQAPANRATRWALMAIGLTLLASIATAWLVSRAITAPVQQLVSSARALGAGQLFTLEQGIMREANIVGLALAEAAEEIATREAHLRDSEARFRNMADHAPVMIWVTDPDGSASFLSASWYEFTGTSPQECTGRGWRNSIHQQDRDRVLSAIARARAEHEPVVVEYRLRRADGTWRWVMDSARPRFTRNRSFLGYIGSIIDITERKQFEEHIALLLREVNHRSKNMLGLVMAVARQTLASDPDDFVARFSDRIQSMSASQDLLVQSDWQGADLHELARTQLAHFADLVGSRIVLDGPPVTLLPQATQSIGMALHELATNAGKYGALSDDAGRVDIEWRVTTGAEPRLSMCWREWGGPPVAEPKQRGFGTTVVDTMVRMALKGSVELVFASDGVVWRLDCPAHMAIDGIEAIGDELEPAQQKLQQLA